MIQSRQKCPDGLGQNIETTSKYFWTFSRRLIEPYLRFIENVQWRSHEVFIKRVLEERVALPESQSKAVIARRPEINEESLALARKRISIPMKDKPILIVDDEKNIRLTLSQSLEVLGVETDSAEDGKEALAKLREKEFGLILLDLHMPRMDGIEVLHQVRASRPDIPIIIITAYGTVKLATEAIKIGVIDFIQKPFVPEQIRERVARVMNREKISQSKDDP
jgi:CheY-like chemotaxis protein